MSPILEDSDGDTDMLLNGEESGKIPQYAPNKRFKTASENVPPKPGHLPYNSFADPDVIARAEPVGPKGKF